MKGETVKPDANLSDAVRKLDDFFREPQVKVCKAQLEFIADVSNAEGLFKRLADAADHETLNDYLAEVRYILVFAGLGFLVEIEPCGTKGPDLKISRDGKAAHVEITRFRPKHDGPPEADFSDPMLTLSQYGNPSRDVRKAMRKIYHKFRQVRDHESIIAIWNDDEDMEELEVQAAVKDLREEREKPEDLAFVMYGSDWIGMNHQLHCYPICARIEPHHGIWMSELSGKTVNQHIQCVMNQSL